MVRFHYVVALTGLLVIPQIASANIINPGVFTSNPSGSWSYSEISGAGHGQSISYFPSAPADFSSAVFQGYVDYDPAVGVPPKGWTGVGNDSMQVFSTYVISSITQSVPIRFTGDDGHSLFANGAFLVGGGFGSILDYNLPLQAGVPVLLELVGYNGPGNWVYEIGLQGQGNLIGPPIDTLPGVTVGANPASIPEPSSALAFGFVFATLVRRQRRSNPMRIKTRSFDY